MLETFLVQKEHRTVSNGNQLFDIVLALNSSPMDHFDVVQQQQGL